jgi:hypothetical protein
LIRPARIISLWLTISASAGASFNVEMKNFEVRMIVGIEVFGMKAEFYRTAEKASAADTVRQGDRMNRLVMAHEPARFPHDNGESRGVRR